MPLLDAALAFVLTMLAVATLVTAIVRVISARETYRSEVLKSMVGQFYESELGPKVRERLSTVEETVDELAQKALDQLSERIDTALMVELSTKDLIDHLRRSELGERIISELTDDGEALFRNLGSRFEAVGDEVSATFRSRSSRASWVVAFVLALSLNVDSVHIARSYLVSDDVRAEILGEQGVILAQYQAMVVAGQIGDADQSDVLAELQRIEGTIESLQASALPVIPKALGSRIGCGGSSAVP